ncbi:MAG: hypothetical protein ACREUQ_00530, partial [Burkholderiales bacterium]
MIGVFNLFDRKENSAMLRIPEATQASWVQWVNENNYIVGLRALLPFGAGERWYVSRIIAVNRVTGKVTKLLWDLGGQKVNLIWTASDGTPNVLI